MFVDKALVSPEGHSSTRVPKRLGIRRLASTANCRAAVLSSKDVKASSGDSMNRWCITLRSVDWKIDIMAVHEWLLMTSSRPRCD